MQLIIKLFFLLLFVIIIASLSNNAFAERGLNFDKKHSYSDDDLLITKMRFVIEQIQPIFKQSEEIYSSHGQPKE
jgi:hypothetical protein